MKISQNSESSYSGVKKCICSRHVGTPGWCSEGAINTIRARPDVAKRGDNTQYPAEGEAERTLRDVIAALVKVSGDTTVTFSSNIPAYHPNGTPTSQLPFYGPATQPSVHGGPSTSQPPVYGDPPTSQPSVYGDPPTSQPPVFGGPPTSQPPVYGDPPTSQPSVYGDPLTSQPPVYGDPPTSQPSVYGDPPTSQPPVYGGSPTSQPSVYGVSPTLPAPVYGGPLTSQPPVIGRTLTYPLPVYGNSPTPQSTLVYGGYSTPQVPVYCMSNTPTSQQHVYASLPTPQPVPVYAEPFVFNSPIYGGPPASYKSNDGPPTTQPHPVCSGPSKVHQPVLVNPLTPSVSIGGPPRTQSDPASSHPSSSPTPQIILEKTSPTTSLTPVGGPSPSQPKSVNGDPLPTQSSLPGGPSVHHVDTSGGAPVMMSGGCPVVQEHKSAHCSYSNPRLNQQSHQLQSGSYLSQDEFPILGTKNSKQSPPAHVNFQPTKSSHAENSLQPPCNSIISYAGKTSMKINEVVVKKEQGIILYTLNSDLCTKIPNIQLIKAVGEKVGPKNVISASRISNGRFCMFLKSEGIAKSFVYFNPQLKINNQNVNVRLYANSAEKLIISNVSTPIPNSILETVLRSHMDIEIMSPIHHMNYGIIDKDYSHLTNFRRYVFIKYDAEVTTIPESLVFDYDKLSYQIYLTIESNKCRLCPDEIHSAKKCPKVQKQNISERLPKPLEPTDQQSNNSDDANTLKPVPTDQIQIQVHAENQPMVETVQESITENITEEQPELSSKRKQSEDNTPVESEVEFEVIAKKSKGKKKTKKNTEQESSNSQRSALTLKDFMVDKGPANRTPLKYQEYKDIMDPLKSIFEDLNKQSSEKLSINSGDVINLLEDCKHSRNKLKIVEAFNVNKEKLQYILNELLNFNMIPKNLKNRVKTIQNILMEPNPSNSQTN
ncbi:hypothetical protein M8J75_012132 [Diaphorina citri]|nr:hypothetical protein M8J75_012132 [Diaphorina citri]